MALDRDKIKRGFLTGKVLEFKVSDDLVREYNNARENKDEKKEEEFVGRLLASAIHYLEIAYPTEDYEEDTENAGD